jgi:uncharacterized protein (TIRG00374 family)
VNKRTAIQILSWVLALAILAVLMWLLDLEALAERLAHARAWMVAAGAILILAFLALKGLRWSVIARAHAPVPRTTCMRLAVVALFLNAFIPLRGGDVTAGLVLARETGLARATCLGTVALDKLFDMVSLAVVVAPLLFLGGLPPWIRWPPVATVSLALVLIAAGIAIRLRMGRREGDIARASWPVRVLARFASGFDSALRPGPLAICLGLSVLQYAILLASVAACLASVGISPDLATSIICLIAVQFASGIPLTPSAAGTMHGAIMAVLAATGVDPETGMSAGIVYHAVQTVPIVAAGVVLARGTAFEPPGAAPEDRS